MDDKQADQYSDILSSFEEYTQSQSSVGLLDLEENVYSTPTVPKSQSKN